MINKMKSVILCAIIATPMVLATGCTNNDLATKVTDKNVNDVVGDYTQVYDYYEKLRLDILEIDKIRNGKKAAKEADAIVKDIETNLSKVDKLEYDYSNIYNAREHLEKCYKHIKKASEKAGNNNDSYDKNIVKFKEDFADLKKSMALARKDIAAIRGTATLDDEAIKATPEAEAGVDDILTEMTDAAASNEGAEDLDAELKKAIEDNGYLSGQEFKANGGSEKEIDKKAGEMFDDLEADNPIEGAQKAVAKAMYISAFKKGYNDYK